MKIYFFTIGCIVCFISSCTITNNISRQKNILLTESSISNAHVGISIFDPVNKKFIYNYNGNKYFTPASNTKLFTLYAGMKYLKDSLTALKYFDTKDTLFVIPTGDPTLFHPDFTEQSTIEFLKEKNKPIVILDNPKPINPYGNGWSADDLSETYAAQKNAMPAYGNILTTNWKKNSEVNCKYELAGRTPSISALNIDCDYDSMKAFSFVKSSNENRFIITFNSDTTNNLQQSIPFETNGIKTTAEILSQLLSQAVVIKNSTSNNYDFKKLKSQSSDSLFSIMMHRSDNFYAEQTLLMASAEQLGYMSDKEIIDFLLKNDCKEIPQIPKWADGSGLSRYNLFTPMDFVYIIDKIRDEFGFERLKKILPTGGEGTLKNYYLQDVNFIYAKTGTLGGVSAISGLMTTSKNKLLVFSVLVNSYNGSSTSVKRAVEQFLHDVRTKN